MGRTLLPFRPALESEINSWADYKRGLRPKDRIIFDQIMNYSRVHADAGSLAGKPNLFAVVLMSVVIEQQKQLVRLEQKMESLIQKKKEC